MRGRTLDDSFIILDEAQNTSREQMKMFLTRLGFGSKIVITGDVTQIDLPDGKPSGLREAMRVLKKVEGIGESAAVLLKIAGQIGRKARLSDATQSRAMTDVETVGAYLLERYAGETHEVVYELCLDRKGKLLACKRLHDGGAASAALDIRKVVENAILTSASTVILAHNHPSGIALPSDDDCAATTHAAQALQTIGVALADHIIVADNDFVSMAQSGYLS